MRRLVAGETANHPHQTALAEMPEADLEAIVAGKTKSKIAVAGVVTTWTYGVAALFGIGRSR